MENENNQLIVLEQLPIIKYKLEQLSIDIKSRLDGLDKLIVNEETVKETKQLRATLNKEFNELEMQRKAVKQAIMSKYDEFEEIYKQCVSELYKNADASLKEKIDNVENQLKQEKETELRQFFDNYNEDYHLEKIIKFEDVGLNITLSASMKSLKDQIVEFFKKVSDDFQAISSCDYREEVLMEYQSNGFNYSQAVNAINEKHRKMEELQQQIEQKANIEQVEQTVVENVNTVVSAPVEVVEEEIIECSFKVKATKTQLKELKLFLQEKGIRYE